MPSQPKPDDRAKATEKNPLNPPDDRRDENPVDEASEESFPASDPPTWTSTTAGGAPDGDRPKKDRPNP